MTTDAGAPVLAALVAAHATGSPDAPAVVTSAGATTYRELDRRARRSAAALVAAGHGRLACRLDDPLDVITLMVAASGARVELCVYPAALPDDEAVELAHALDHTTVVAAGPIGQLTTVAPAAVLPAEGPEAEWPADDRAAPLLILTTGTTGRPKGTRHDWRRLVRAATRWSSPAGGRWLLAYNLNQFAGFQVVLHVLTSGAALVVPDRIQPRDASLALQEHGVTHVSATPTFWRHLLTLLGDGPLPALEQVTLGGESVPARLVEDLRRAFPDARVSQVYASTEFGSSVAVNDTTNGLPLSVLDRDDDADVRFTIVDGELHVRSRVGMLGYHGEDGDIADGWRPTGDMVEIRDGRIHFVGRSAEIINVGGVKVHPLTVEERVTAVPGVRFAHARGRANPVSGQIVVLDVVRDPDADEDEVEDAIREACEVLAPAARPRRIRFVDELEIKEHKVRRAGGSA